MNRHPSIEQRRRVRLFLSLVFLLGAAGIPSAPVRANVPPTPPGQPPTGDGGAAAGYPAVVATRHGSRPTGYWLFEPASEEGDAAKPIASAQPLVIFLHGFTAVDPKTYRAWIDHIVRRGAVVVYPDYQTLNPFTLRPDEYLGNAMRAVRDVLGVAAEPGHTPVDPARVGVVGHSVGGILTADYAAEAGASGLPVPSVMMPVAPGGCRGCGQGPDFLGVPISDLSTIPETVRAIVVVGADDESVGETGAKTLWAAMPRVSLDRRDYVIIQSDGHGAPPLTADHLFTQGEVGGGDVDALDWFGSWKFFDALTGCAFAKVGCDTLNGSGAETFMGMWSDGVPVKPAIVTDDPGAP